MIGMVLAAGASRRLRPDTDALPKALLPVAGETTILDIALRNLSAVGLRDVVVVVGHAASVIGDRAGDMQRRHGVTLHLVHNERALDWNNAYSLWLAREYFARGVLLVSQGKGGRDRVIPIGDRALAWVERYLVDESLHGEQWPQMRFIVDPPRDMKLLRK